MPPRFLNFSKKIKKLAFFNDDHIDAHLTICMLALTVIRIIKNKIVEYQHGTNTNNSTIVKHKLRRDKYWEFGLNGDRIKKP